MSADRDVLVIGAGPAGLAAALAAADRGARVELLDGQPRPGGQYWRHGPEGQFRGQGSGQHLLGRWRELAGRLSAAEAAGRITRRPGVQVWRLDRPDPVRGRPWFRACATESWRPGAEGEGRALIRTAATVVLATGAQERVLPFPGWTLPGVLTPGAAQGLLKEHGVLAGRRVVVAGTGPFLLAVAAGLAGAGSAGAGLARPGLAGGRPAAPEASVVAVLEAGDGRGWLRRWPALAGRPEVLAEAAGYAAVLARHRIPVRLRRAVIEAHGGDRVQAVTVARLDRDWRPVPGSERRLECDAVAVGYGFLPRLDLAGQAGCGIGPGHGGIPVVRADEHGRSTVPGLLVAGELTGIGGAPLALLSGVLAGRAAAALAAGRRPGPVPEVLRRRRARLVRFAAALQAAHPVPTGWTSWLRPDTVLCRCEEVPLARVREAVAELQAGDPRTVRSLTRCGMGWCQGRICAEGVAGVLATLSGPAGAQVPARPFAEPVTLGELAGLDGPAGLDGLEGLR